MARPNVGDGPWYEEVCMFTSIGPRWKPVYDIIIIAYTYIFYMYEV